jgi:uncharacterized membrane protein
MAHAGMNAAPANPNLIKVGQNGCEGKMSCSGHAAEGASAGGKEKCYGVVKAGANDCANASKSHSCAGQAASDGDVNEWVALPAGVCAKLVGGSVTPPGEAQ